MEAKENVDVTHAYRQDTHCLAPATTAPEVAA